MMAWGHEIIHGFDTNGAKFDQVGNWGPLWANENDSQEFQKRAYDSYVKHLQKQGFTGDQLRLQK